MGVASLDTTAECNNGEAGSQSADWQGLDAAARTRSGAAEAARQIERDSGWHDCPPVANPLTKH
jgi:hypothetical protein